MKKIKNPWLHNEEYHCFGCCPDNPLGLKMEFYEEGDEIISYWHPSEHYQGWVGVMHGGNCRLGRFEKDANNRRNK